MPNDTPMRSHRPETSQMESPDRDGFRFDWVTVGVLLMIAVLITLFIL